MSLSVFSTALAMSVAVPAPSGDFTASALAAIIDTTLPVDTSRAATRRRALARRDSLRAQIARLRAACGPACDSSNAFDTAGSSDVGRVVGESVSASMRGAAVEIRRATGVVRSFGFGRDYEIDARDLTGPTRLDTTVSFTRGGAVDVALVTGPVTVTAWDRAEVRVRGRSDHLPFRFERTDGPNGGSVRVYTIRARGRTAGDQQLDVVVPFGTRVTANSVSGNVRVRDVRGELDAESVSGDVDVQGGTRRVSLTSVSGSVHGDGVNGDLRARSVSGDVRITRARGEADVGSVSGSVDLRGILARVRAQTVSGDLTYDGPLARNGRYDLGSQSGDVHLVLQRDVGAALSLQTFSGSIDASVPLTLQPTARGTDGTPLRSARRLEFTVGGGGARVTAQSFSGTIVISRSTTPPN